LPGFEHFENDRSWSIHERDESIRDMNQESIDRLSPEQIQQINRIAGDLIESSGYTKL
jgi:hypothetical protein